MSSPYPRSLRRRIAVGVALLALASSACLEPFSAQPDPKTGKVAADQAADGKRDPKKTKKKNEKNEKPKQTYAEAWQRICHAERLSGDSAKVSEWIVANVSNKKARYWWIGYAKVKKAEREAYLRQEALKAGQPRCPLAKLLFPAAKPPASKPAPSSQPAK